jgi:cytidylate kinase
MTEHNRRLIVTIDGPAGTGKSSVARELAREQIGRASCRERV